MEDLWGFTGAWNGLSFWAQWLHRTLQHTPPNQMAAVLQRFYTTSDPLAGAVAVALLLAMICFLLSLPTNRHSWVDKLWSIVPVFYAWHFVFHDRLSQVAHGTPVTAPLNLRLLVMAVLASVWGTRLTWNFARKGGYGWAEEDYRWPYIRARVHPLAFLLFNATFIAVYQHLLLLGLVTPAYVAWQGVETPLGAVDAAALALCLFFIAFETEADQQQWRFQSAKHARLAAGKRLGGQYAQGFLTAGLWRYSRHPNFWAEQCLWWSFYLFGASASGRWLNWTLAAPLQLSLLFQGSTWLTERITAAKYPGYARYQRTTSRLMPWFPAEGGDGEEGQGDSEEEEEAEREGSEEEEEAGVAVEEEEEEEMVTTTARQPARRRSSAAAAAAGAPSRTPRRASRAAAATPRARSAAKAEKAEEEEEQYAAAAEEPAPATAARRRAGRGRTSKVAAVEQQEEAAAAEAEAAPAVAARPARSPRKTAKALAASDTAPVPTRQSSRLRAKTSGKAS